MPRLKTLDKRRVILEAATKVFAMSGFHDVLIDRVAHEAGVGKGTIYRYFQTKEELYFGTLFHGIDELADTLKRTLPTEATPTRRLERIAREILEFFWNRPDLLTLLYTDEHRFAAREEEFRKRREVVQKLVQQAILDGIQCGDFRGIDARVGAELFRGMVRAAGCFRRESDTIDDLVAEILGIFTRGVFKQR
jgi:AcrR family transcriptional regulator